MAAMRDLLEQFFKFGLVGGLGLLTNTIVFFLLVDVSGVPPDIGSVCSFAVAVTQNFFLNRIWTFSGEKGLFRFRREGARVRTPLPLLQYFKFVGTSLGGLAVNLLVLNEMITLVDLPVKTLANLVGVGAGMMVNFLGYRLWVFRRSQDVGPQSGSR